jgi:hypothetical protein
MNLIQKEEFIKLSFEIKKILEEFKNKNKDIPGLKIEDNISEQGSILISVHSKSLNETSYNFHLEIENIYIIFHDFINDAFKTTQKKKVLESLIFFLDKFISLTRKNM